MSEAERAARMPPPPPAWNAFVECMREANPPLHSDVFVDADAYARSIVQFASVHPFSRVYAYDRAVRQAKGPHIKWAPFDAELWAITSASSPSSGTTASAATEGPTPAAFGTRRTGAGA
jgi:hypothetical protein